MEALLKFGESFSNALRKITQFLLTVIVLALFVLVNVQVFFRYVLGRSLGGLEELPVLMMAVSVWLSAPVVSLDDAHINIDFFTGLIKGVRGQLVAKMFAQLVAAGSMAFFVKLAFEYVADSYRFGEVTGGLGIPIWVFHAIITYGAIMVTVFSLANALRSLYGIITYKKTGGDGNNAA